MMHEQDIIDRLYKTGHFWNPANPDGLNIKRSDLPKLTLTDKVVVKAAASFQWADANMEALVGLHHKRALIPDGDVGPATLDMLDMPRCPMPDFTPPPDADFNYGDPQIQEAVKSQRDFATGSGSWLASGCDPEHKGGHSIRVGINTSNASSTVKNYLDKCAAECVKAYAEVGLRVRYIFDTKTVVDCEIQKEFERLSGNVIGWNYFPTPNSCRRITGRLSSSYAPSDWRMFANLKCHETGHGVGLNHGRGSIMNASILLVWPMTFVGTYSFPNLERWFGGKPITPDVPEIPLPPGEPLTAYLTGSLQIIHDGKPAGDFIFVPKKRPSV